MTEQINEIINFAGSRHFYLQSTYNDTDFEGQPQAGSSYYVGYFCTGAEDASPLPGEQPGQAYETSGIASIDNAPDDIEPPL